MTASSSRRGGDLEIIGRDVEMAVVRRTTEREVGAPANLTLHGDPGIGKTALLRWAVAEARQQGMRVLGGCGYESEARLAFAGLHQLFMPVLEYLDRVEPYHQDTLRRVLRLEPGPAPDRLAVSVASLAVLAAVAEDGPVLIAVEDAHWVDVPTREVMMFLIVRLEPYDIRAIFARRPLISTERVGQGIGMLEVGPLSDAAARDLLARLHPGLSPQIRDRVLADSAGNPLALAELPETYRDDAVPVHGALPSGTPLRTRLEAGYASRALQLPPSLRTALLLTALDGSRLEHGNDSALPSTLSPYDVVEIEWQGLITRDSTPSGLRFRHPLVRSAVINTASPAEIRQAHAVLAEQYRHDPERRMWHLAAASVEPHEATAAEIESAALITARHGGAGLAATALARAAGLTPDPAEAARRLHQAAELATQAGQLDKAQQLVDEARAHREVPAHAGHSLTTRALILLLRDGDFGGSRRLLARAMDPTTGSDAEALERAALLRCALASYLQDAEEWADAAQAMKEHAAILSPHAHLLYAVLSGEGSGDTVRRVEEAVSDASAETPPPQLGELCRMATRLDMLDSCRPLYGTLMQQADGPGAVTHATSGLWFDAHAKVLGGEWDEAQGAADAALELSTRHGLTLLTQDVRCMLGLLAALRGDADHARMYSQGIERWAEPRGSAQHLAMSARNLALAALGRGAYEEAYGHGVRVAAPGTFPRFAVHAPWTVLDLVEAAVRTGRTAEALAHVRAALEAGLDRRSPRLRLLTMAAHALSAEEPDQAVALYGRALAGPRVERYPFEQARVRLALGELHRRSHRPGAARTELRRAADQFARLGARDWRHRAEQELRAAGVAVAPAQTSLTAQQMEVAQLAASGLSNKEIGERLFLSPRTVSAHLYRIFPKLGITSRSALRDALADLGEPPP